MLSTPVWEYILGVINKKNTHTQCYTVAMRECIAFAHSMSKDPNHVAFCTLHPTGASLSPHSPHALYPFHLSVPLVSAMTFAAVSEPL